MVKLLLERHAHLLSVAGANGLTIAHMAAERGSLEVVRQVIAIDRRVACFAKNAVRYSAVLFTSQLPNSPSTLPVTLHGHVYCNK